MRTNAAFLVLVILVAVLFAAPPPLPVSGWSALSESGWSPVPGAAVPLPQLQSWAVSSANRSTLACPTDDYEPNDSFSAAYAISPGTQYTAYICPSGDEDWFRFWVQAGQEITADLTGLYVDLPADLDLDLYDPGEVVVAQSHESFTYPEHIVYTAEQQGEYRVRVSGYGGAYSAMNPYRLLVTLSAVPTATRTHTPPATPSATRTVARTETPTPTGTVTATPTVTEVSCPADAYEENGSFDTAALIESGVTLAAYICPEGDVDYFKFWVVIGQQLTVLLSDLPASYDLEVFDPNQAKRISSYGTTPVPREVTFTADRTGHWYARVLGSHAGQWSVDPYSLRLTLGEVPTPTLTSTATRTPTGTPTRTPTRTPTATQTPTRTPTSTSVPPTPTPYLTQLPTSLLTPTEILCPTDHEPNGTFAEATLLGSGEMVLSYICPADDLDHFKVFAEKDHEITVELFDMSYNADLELYNPSEVKVAESRNVGVVPDVLGVIADQTGWFYARVFGTDDDLVNPYHLRLTASAQPVPTNTPTPPYPGCYDAYEFNNVCGQDRPEFDLPPSGVTSYLCSATDNDYWRIPSVGVGQTIDIALTYPGMNYELELYNPQCQSKKWAYGYSGQTTVRLRYTAMISGTWYVRVFYRNGSFSVTVPYTISGGVYDCVRDRLEDNDNSNDATEFDRPTVPRTEAGLDICPPGEQDWFELWPHDGDSVVADLTHDRHEGALRMCLRDDYGNMVQCTDPYEDLNHIDYFVERLYSYWYLIVEPVRPEYTNPNYSITVQMRPGPTPTPTRTPTVTWGRRWVGITGVEVTQGIQDSNTSRVPLIQGKTAVVRVYAQVIDKKWDIPGATAEAKLEYSYPGAVVLYPLGYSDGTITQRAPARDKLVQAFTFVIPGKYLVDSPRLTVRIRPPPGISFNDTGVAETTRQLTLTTAPPLKLVFVPVTYTMDSRVRLPDPSAAGAIRNWLQRAYPVPYVIVSTHSMTQTYSGTPLDLCAGPGFMEINKQLAKLRETSLPKPGNDTYYYGLVPADYTYYCPSSYVAGCASDIPSHEAAGVALSGQDTAVTAAHELGHCLGRYHAECCGARGGKPYPYPYCGISPADDSLYGLDAQTLQVYPPTTRDLMSYCRDPWLSDFTYNALRDAISASSSAAAATAAPQPMLLVSGLFNHTSGETQLDPFYRLTVTPPDGPSGDTCHIDLLDGTGQLLGSYPFAPRVDTEPVEGRDEMLTILEWVPDHAGLAKVEVYCDGAKLATREASPHAPTVRLLSPNGGETWASGAQSVAWEASDEDGDELRFIVQSSCDGGSSWTTLYTDLSGRSVGLDTSLLPGSNSTLLRVIVSDGMRASEDVSDAPFTVAAKKPAVSIDWPEDGAELQYTGFIALSGHAFDPEDGPLGDSALTWTSDRDGLLGNGGDIVIPKLGPGWHTITLRATDSDGNVAEDSIRLWAGDQVYLPIILK